MDFLVSDVGCYRNLRQLITGTDGMAAVLLKNTDLIIQARAVRADQYGIRTALQVADQAIKFEIVLEARIELEASGPKDQVCGVSTLTPLDLVTSKLLANSDRWADQSVFSRDVIDLAMMKPSLRLLRKAIAKAEWAYGNAIRRDLEQAVQHLQDQNGRLERCMEVMAMDLPKAKVWKNLRALRRVLRD